MTAMKERMNSILEHYYNAVEKHPKFCNKFAGWCHLGKGKLDLCLARMELANKSRLSCATAFDVLKCAVAEVNEAYRDGKMKQVKAACYGCIAVLLRMVDWIEREEEEQS